MMFSFCQSSRNFCAKIENSGVLKLGMAKMNSSSVDQMPQFTELEFMATVQSREVKSSVKYVLGISLHYFAENLIKDIMKSLS